MEEGRRVFRRIAIVSSLALALGCLLAPSALAAKKPKKVKDTTTWLCKPGIPNNPCEPGFGTTVVTPSGGIVTASSTRPQPARKKTDCFYVYPTVSDDKSANSDLSIDPEELSIALYQAARYSLDCRVFAPMYRQVTLQGILGIHPGSFDLAYSDVLAAWNTYLQKYNHGRGVVLIGHSQGSAMLTRLVREQIDPNPAERRKLVSALLLGEPSPLGPIDVPIGGDVGGTFKHVRVCHSIFQFGCVIGFSTFNAPPPANALFGRTSTPGMRALCTNPARLFDNGLAPLKTIFPTTPFAPATTIGAVTQAVGFTVPPVSTPWVETVAFSGRCEFTNGANTLQIRGLPGAPTLHPIPDPGWGLHLVDANIALGNLLNTVRVQGFIHFVFNRLHHR
jgi:Protein of unknown function (DUF3089)